MSATVTAAPAAVKSSIVGGIITKVEGDISGVVTRELTFFETHPKAIAIGVGVIGVIVGFLVRAFLFH